MPRITHLGMVSVLALLFGVSAAWNIRLLAEFRSLPEIRERQVISVALESIRRSGTVLENDPASNTLTVQYAADSGVGKKQMLIHIQGETQLQRIHSTVEGDAIVALRTEHIEQTDIVEGEPVYVITAPGKTGELLRATTVVVGDVLPRQ